MKLIKDDKKRRPDIVPVGAYLRIFPNPSSDYVILSYKVKPAVKTYWIMVSRMNGTIVTQMELNKRQDQKVYPTRDLVTGSYIISLFGDGRLIQSQKLIIIH